MVSSRFLTLVSFIFITVNLCSQTRSSQITGKVTDESNRPIEMATVILNNSLITYTTHDGTFKFDKLGYGTFSYSVSYLGYETARGEITLSSATHRLNVSLKPLVLTLSTVEVTARQDQTGSKSVIGQDAIRHIQPKSLNDLFQLVPGNMIANPNLNQLGQAQIREIGSNDNNALGTSVIVDGTPLSNNANLQVIAPSKYATSSAATFSGMSQQTTGGRGVDLRTVSAGNIESVEVIRGIPSVEYGNLTSGVVIVKTKSGATPLGIKFQADPFSKLAYAEKGLLLSQGGALNFSLDWSQSWADPRRHYLGFNRITGSAGYSQKLGAMSLNIKGSVYTNVNTRKDDPQFRSQNTHYKSQNTGFRLSVNGNVQFSKSFLNTLDYNLSFQYAHTSDSHDTWVSNPDGLVTTARTSGIHVAQMRNVGYTSAYVIDGKPINIFFQTKTGKYIQFNDANYTMLKAGVEYSYDANKGKGFTYDENNPPQSQGSQTLRPRAFSSIPGLFSITAFISDKLHLKVASTTATLDAGVRLTNLFVDRKMSGGISNYFVAEPRINLAWNILNRKNSRFPESLTLTGGYGISNKLPTILYLYPDVAYFDNPSLSKYGDLPEDRLGLITTDIVTNTANSQLKPARSIKWEAGLSFAHKGISGFLTYFNERINNEFDYTGQLIWQNYVRYSVPPTATQPAFHPETQDVTYLMDGSMQTASKTNYTEVFSWQQATNSTTTAKHGLEYGIRLPEWKPIRTAIDVSGAWFYIKRTHRNTGYQYVNSTYPYIGVIPEGQGTVTQRVNSTFRIITHIPVVKMVFTTAVQVVWHESERQFYEDAQGHARYKLRHFNDRDYYVVEPLGYYDLAQTFHPWTETDWNDPQKVNIVYKALPYTYEKDVVSPWAMLSFRFTKEIGKIAEISIIGNNVTNTRKWHTNKYSLAKSQLYPDMYFGMELKLKL